MEMLSLSSLSWRFRNCAEKEWLPAKVPGCVHTDLLAAGKIPDPFWADNELKLQWIEECDWEYATTFSLAKSELAPEVIELVADGLDTVAKVTLNGAEVGRTENMFLGYRWNVKRWLRPGKNELRIRFSSAMDYVRTHRLNHQPREINDPVGRCTVIRKQQCQFGWDWGPRFVTAGIWRDLRLETWSGNRVTGMRIQQTHTKTGAVRVTFAPELARKENGVTCRWRWSQGGTELASGEGRALDVARPQLWWPNGQGAQPLYRLEVEVLGADGSSLGRCARTIGLRTIELERKPDVAGETFRFRVNGRLIFVKGANWIPAHSFVAGLKRSDYARDLRAAVSANMNMIRVWGGGIYESDDFYDLCDELGLLVWQDDMFACTLYPADSDFIDSVRDEIAYQTKRLRHRACLALWCGNNEVFSCNAHELNDPAKKKLYAEYEKLFHRHIPEVHARHDGVTPFWPSSPWRGDTAADHGPGEKRGDTHYWDVWHARLPVKEYERWNFRFVSEFGMQSYASPTTQATFAPAEDEKLFGPAMENHQKNRGGNQVILDYISRRYRFPKDQPSLIYLSQLNQAHCMQVGVNHYRRLMPHCMGAMYWQLNDCWPVASWSSIEFNGRWKALHYTARRFFAPTVVSVHVPGDETPIIGNYSRSTVREAHIYTVHDGPEPLKAALRWDLFHVDGRVLSSGSKNLRLSAGQSVRQKSLDLSSAMKKHGRSNIYLRVALAVGAETVSEDAVFLTLPRFVNLPKSNTQLRIRELDTNEFQLQFTSSNFQHYFCYDLPGSEFSGTDNYFEMFPGETKTVVVRTIRPLKRSEFERILEWRSLVDSY